MLAHVRKPAVVRNAETIEPGACYCNTTSRPKMQQPSLFEPAAPGSGRTLPMLASISQSAIHRGLLWMCICLHTHFCNYTPNNIYLQCTMCKPLLMQLCHAQVRISKDARRSFWSWEGSFIHAPSCMHHTELRLFDTCNFRLTGVLRQVSMIGCKHCQAQRQTCTRRSSCSLAVLLEVGSTKGRHC